MPRHSSRHRGFTLVEMLVVIAIIVVLAAILLPAINYVRVTARVTEQAAEIANLVRSIEQYRNKVGDYPPDFADYVQGTGNPSAALQATVAYRHITRFYGRIDPSELVALGALAESGYFNPATSLYFFVGGLSDDKRYPFSGPGGPLNAASDRNSEDAFDFDETRLVAVPGYTPPISVPPPKVYFPKHAEAPYVYFDSRTYEYVNRAAGVREFSSVAYDPSLFGFNTPNPSVARPYKSLQRNPAPQEPDQLLHWAERDKFQLICSGFDGEYGVSFPLVDNGAGTPTPVMVVFPVMMPFHPGIPLDPTALTVAAPYNVFDVGHRDNLTNFSSGKKLEDLIP